MPDHNIEPELARLRAALQQLRSWALDKAPGSTSTFSPATTTRIAMICEEGLGLVQPEDGKPSTGEIWEALKESVKLQSHYAALLNSYDFGQRISFAGPNEWIARLRKIKEETCG